MRILLALALAAASAFAQNPVIRANGVNAQTGTTYTYLASDFGKLVTHTNSGAIAATLPQASATFPSGWLMDVQNRGAGTLTITPTTSTIDGAASLALTTGQGTRVFSNGTNYFTQRGVGGSSGGSGAGITYCADATGSTTAYTSACSPAYTLSLGARATFVPQTSNSTTTPTINLTSTGVKNIKNADSSALSIGQFLAGVPYDLEYNGTDQLVMGIGSTTVTPSGANDLVGSNIVNGIFTISEANEAVTGTTDNRFAILTPTAKVAPTSTTTGIVGILRSGGGTTGNARIVVQGRVTCDFDGATTTNHWVKVSASTAGKCTDTGTATTSAAPAGSAAIVLSTNGGAGTYSVLMALGAQGGGSGGGSGATISSGAYAGVGACGASPFVYLAKTDSALQGFCDGASGLSWFYKGLPVTPTVVGDLATWFNQGGASVTSYAGSWLLTGTTGGGDTWRGRYKTTPATPYSIVTCMEGLTGAANFAGFGAFWTDGTKMITTAIQNQVANTPGVIGILKFTNASTYSGAYLAGNTAVTPSGMFCIALVDDGTNRKEKFSYDGVNWTLLHTVGRTDFLTATGAGVIVEDGANSGLAAQVQVVSVVTLASAL